LTQGSLRLSAASASRARVAAFSFLKSFFRAVSHAFCDTTLLLGILGALLFFNVAAAIIFLSFLLPLELIGSINRSFNQRFNVTTNESGRSGQIIAVILPSRNCSVY
jgi:hypothetical protein